MIKKILIAAVLALTSSPALADESACNTFKSLSEIVFRQRQDSVDPRMTYQQFKGESDSINNILQSMISKAWRDHPVYNQKVTSTVQGMQNLRMEQKAREDFAAEYYNACMEAFRKN